jgi:hypothetical protein
MGLGRLKRDEDVFGLCERLHFWHSWQ